VLSAFVAAGFAGVSDCVEGAGAVAAGELGAGAAACASAITGFTHEPASCSTTAAEPLTRIPAATMPITARGLAPRT